MFHKFLKKKWLNDIQDAIDVWNTASTAAITSDTKYENFD